MPPCPSCRSKRSLPAITAPGWSSSGIEGAYRALFERAEPELEIAVLVARAARAAPAVPPEPTEAVAPLELGKAVGEHRAALERVAAAVSNAVRDERAAVETREHQALRDPFAERVRRRERELDPSVPRGVDRARVDRHLLDERTVLVLEPHGELARARRASQ